MAGSVGLVVSRGELFSELLRESLFPMDEIPLSEISSLRKGTSWTWNIATSSPGSSQERSRPSPTRYVGCPKTFLALRGAWPVFLSDCGVDFDLLL